MGNITSPNSISADRELNTKMQKIVRISLLAESSNGTETMIPVYIGSPNPRTHPLAFQSKFASNRGYHFKREIMDALEELHQIAIKYKMSLAELCEQEFVRGVYNRDMKTIIAKGNNKI